MLSYCLFCGVPTSNVHGFCSEQCYDDHALALEETKLLPAVPDDKCPLCGSAKDCTCSYVVTDCWFCGESLPACTCNDTYVHKWEPDYIIDC